MTRAELKQNAKRQLSGHWGWAVLVTFLALLLDFALTDLTKWAITGRDWLAEYERLLNGIFWIWPADRQLWYNCLLLIVGIFEALISWGLAFSFLELVDTGRPRPAGRTLFGAMTSQTFGHSLLTCFLTGLFISLWSLLLFIPGIVKGYAYSQTPYIMKDMFAAGHQMTAAEAITASRQVMAGHKAELFVLDLSFLGWFLLGTLTCGIGMLWIGPYYRATRANYYRHLVGNRFLTN